VSSWEVIDEVLCINFAMVPVCFIVLSAVDTLEDISDVNKFILISCCWEEIDEVLEAGERGRNDLGHGHERFHILERDDHPVHGVVLEDQKPDYGRQTLGCILKIALTKAKTSGVRQVA